MSLVRVPELVSEERSRKRINSDDADRRSPGIEHTTRIPNHEMGKSATCEYRVRQHCGIEQVSHFVVTVALGAKYS
jgi:hypothetical protein